MCVCSNSLNDVPRVAQRNGTIAPHTRRRAAILIVFVVFCVHMYNFAGLIRRTPPPTFSDTAVTDRHSDTTIFQLRAHWVRICWSVGSEKSFRHVPPGGSRTLDFLRARRAPYPLGQDLRDQGLHCLPFHLHLSDTLLYVKPKVSIFRIFTVMYVGVSIFKNFRGNL